MQLHDRSAHASLPPKGGHAHISAKALSGQRSPTRLVDTSRFWLTGKRRASGSELLVKLEFLLFVVRELAFAFDVFETLVNVNVACCLVEESTASVQTGLDVRNHFIDSREVDDGLTELLTVL